jgi:hypothetical protein
MAVFRIEKTKDYTVMSNYHLRDREVSLKGKGLLSLMLSLPPEWDYSLAGLAAICHDGIGSVRSGVAELEKHGYLTRRRLRNDNGQLGDIEYTILEMPLKTGNSPVDNSPPVSNNPTSKKPICENPTQVNPMYGECRELSINQSRTKELNTDLLNIHQSIRTEAHEALSYQQKEIDAMDSIDIYREIIMENIDYHNLCAQYKYGVDEITEILELMVETVCSNRKIIRIGGEDKPIELVKSRLLKLDFTHIEYVMECMSKNTTDVRNIKSYMLTTLFNAPYTIGSYYKSRVNHDMYGK